MRADQFTGNWMASLNENDRIVTCTIVRGEILFGISRLPEGKRRDELERLANRFLDVFHCEPIPTTAGDFYAQVKLTRQRSGLTMDENDLWIAATAMALEAILVSRDSDFDKVEGLRVVAPA